MADDDGVDNAAMERVFQEQTTARVAAVEASVRAGRGADAMRLALQDPPFASKEQAVKDASFSAFLRAAQACGSREDQLADFLTSMSDADAADVAMKYTLRGLKSPDNAALFLKLHGLLLERAGMGCLVRAMVDRKTA
jgi:hypothetical protein